jgi:xanthine/uracil permease
VFEVLRVVVTTLVVGSLVTLVGYALAFAGVAVWTVAQARRRPTFADELDAVLAEILRA